MYEIHFYRDKNGKEPVRDRILFAAWDGSGFVLLHVFMKQTQKTPSREIARAKRNLADYRERRERNEKR